MPFRPDLSREEDYLVKATLFSDDVEIKDIPCKICLPERTNEKPYLILKPSSEGAPLIMGSHKWGFKALVHGFDGEIQATFEAPEVYFTGASTKRWGGELSETTIPGEPQNLFVIYPLPGQEKTKHTHLTFWLSPNKFLTPRSIRSMSETGNVDYEWVKTIKFTINGGLNLHFQKHFRCKTTPNGDFLQWSFLVACTELNSRVNDVQFVKENLLQDIDDFLLLAGFAARQRTACLGWTAIDSATYTTNYRGNYTFPDGKNNDLEDCVVGLRDFEEFAEICYPIFLEYENKIAIRNALYSAVPSKSHTIETTFLHMFSGLETLILDFRRRECKEFVMPPEEFSIFRKALQSFISKSEEVKLEKKQRASIYKKLGELNRVSLREAFDLFCYSYDINLSDLWPVFSSKEAVGLVEIRNKLIHGDPFPHDIYESLIVATEHLKYVLERVLVSVLGWDVERTKVSPANLEKYWPEITDLPRRQKRINEYLSL